ncbi:MAG: tyrosine-type recombinase/integrase [Pyrinomonadaceae bacterium]
MPRKKKLPKYVVKRDGKWYVRVRLPGIRRRVRDETPEGAERMIEKIRTERRLLEEEIARIKTVGEVAAAWLRSKKNKVSPRHFEDLTRHALQFNKKFGALPIDRLTPALIEEFYLELEDRGKLWLVEKIHRSLRAMLNYAVRFDHLSKNPAKVVTPSKKPKKEVIAMTASEARAFLAACRSGEKRGLVFEVALFTGMRPGEYLALRWQDLDLKKNRLQVRRALARYHDSGGYYFKELKTTSSRRVIDIPEDLAAKLAELREKAEKKRGFKKTDLIFRSQNGEPLNIHNLARREFKGILKAADLDQKKFNPYSLRHTCATLLFHENASLKTVQERLGHASAKTTMDTYIHFIPSLQKEATEKLSGVLY